MTKSELKTGHVATLRNGQKYMIYKDVCFSGKTTVLIASNGHIYLDSFNDDLTHHNSGSFDIIKIEECLLAMNLVQNVDQIYELHMKHIWERKEPKKMTVAEIEAILGYKIEVVSEK